MQSCKMQVLENIMIRCYCMDISCDCSFEQSQALCRSLPKERLERIERMQNEALRQKNIMSAAFLQCCLEKETGIPREQIQLQYGENGKPMLPGLVDFNLSHSGSYAVAVVSDSPIGVDIEHARKRNRLAVANRFFQKEEYEDIMAAGNEEEQQRRFLRYWTMKEAYVKRTGEGMRTPFDSFRCMPFDERLSFVQGENVWFLTQFLAEGYCVSICSEKKEELDVLCGKAKIWKNMGIIDLVE